ncbi:MAG: PilW family protein [Pseudomonadaceae bacterium]|nr:PilW family protein [Pseudomonadaceae bacterium]
MSKHINLRHQQGLSLVELMVALVLGLILMTGIIQVFLSSKQTYNANEAMARMQENGRFALDFMSRSARLAGYIEPIYTGNKPLPLVRNLCPNPDPTATPTELCTNDGGGNRSDRVSFIMQPPLVDGTRRDCLGNPIADATLIINQFYIIPSPDAGVTPAALGCRTANLATPEVFTSGVLVDGIDSMQVLYGISTGGDSRSANQYVSAERVGLNLSDWQDVRSVRISVLANSVITTDATPATRQFALLDAAPLTVADLGNDRRSRQIFTTTIQLKNTD